MVYLRNNLDDQFITKEYNKCYITIDGNSGYVFVVLLDASLRCGDSVMITVGPYNTSYAGRIELMLQKMGFAKNDAIEIPDTDQFTYTVATISEINRCCSDVIYRMQIHCGFDDESNRHFSDVKQSIDNVAKDVESSVSQIVECVQSGNTLIKDGLVSITNDIQESRGLLVDSVQTECTSIKGELTATNAIIQESINDCITNANNLAKALNDLITDSVQELPTRGQAESVLTECDSLKQLVNNSTKDLREALDLKASMILEKCTNAYDDYVALKQTFDSAYDKALNAWASALNSIKEDVTANAELSVNFKSISDAIAELRSLKKDFESYSVLLSDMEAMAKSIDDDVNSIADHTKVNVETTRSLTENSKSLVDGLDSRIEDLSRNYADALEVVYDQIGKLSTIKEEDDNLQLFSNLSSSILSTLCAIVVAGKIGSFLSTLKHEEEEEKDEL